MNNPNQNQQYQQKGESDFMEVCGFWHHTTKQSNQCLKGSVQEGRDIEIRDAAGNILVKIPAKLSFWIWQNTGPDGGPPQNPKAPKYRMQLLDPTKQRAPQDQQQMQQMQQVQHVQQQQQVAQQQPVANPGVNPFPQAGQQQAAAQTGVQPSQLEGNPALHPAGAPVANPGVNPGANPGVNPAAQPGVPPTGQQGGTVPPF